MLSLNILRQAVNPKRFMVMARKVLTRFKERSSGLDKNQNEAWIKNNLSNFSDLAQKISPPLWQEAQSYAQQCQEQAQIILSKLDFPLGGGAYYPLLYFITRWLRPQTIVETGVAAGFSSSAFLSAIKRNGAGKLYSSDFPYFRLKNPEQFIGCIVAEDLKRDWILLIDGDEASLPRISAQVTQVDLFHYDSDKSYAGRLRALQILEKKFSEKTILIIDDIQDNNFFYDYVNGQKPQHWYVFEFNGKYIGLIGDLSLVT